CSTLRPHRFLCAPHPQLAQKYDHQREQELREWIEGVTGRRIGNNFMDGLKDGIILCEFINKLQPGSVKKVNESTQNWHQVSPASFLNSFNIGNFIKAITKYGVKPHDIFEANDLFENTNHTQVQSTLLALASMAKTKGNKVNVGVKYAEKQERRFEPEKLREGRNIIGLQMGTNKFASQQGMTAYGTRRPLYAPHGAGWALWGRGARALCRLAWGRGVAVCQARPPCVPSSLSALF
uniref:Calponin n=1 Tax=Panthera tigris altaica TaxID=74533 RepID=A0A8C9JTH6_PANTA